MATRPLPEPAESQFAPYVKELHEFFAESGLRFGAAEDIPAITDRLRTPGSFHDDLSSLVRSFVLRQGGAMPHAQLLELLAFAIAGPEMARSPQLYREPLRELLGFVAGVMRRPWNVPAGERYESAEVVPFPAESSSRTAGAAAEPEETVPVAEMRTDGLEPLPGVGPSGGAEGAAGGAVAAQPKPSRPAPIPIAARQPSIEAATPPLLPDNPLPPQTPSDPIPQPEPSPAPDARREVIAPMSAISAALAAESERAGLAQESLPPIAQVPEERPLLRPIPNAVRTPEEDGVQTRRSPFPTEMAIAALGGLALAAVLIFSSRAHKAAEVQPVQPVPAATSTPSGQAPVRPSLASGTAYPPKPSAYGARLTGQALRRARQVAAAAAKEDVAQPYSSAPQYAPGRANAVASAATAQPAASGLTTQPRVQSVPPAQTQSNSSPTVDGGAVPTQPPAPIVRESPARRPKDPDATIVGDSPKGTQFLSNAPTKQGYFTVSSGVMAANLLSSPEPEYPLLARLAHVEGKVILQAVIAKDGAVATTRVLRGSRLLRGAAQDAVRRWRYRPFRMNGRPVDVATIVTVDFHNGASGTR